MNIITQSPINAILRTEFHGFFEMVFRTVNPSTLYQPNWSLEAISWQLERMRRGDINRLVINVPPRSGKSLLSSVAYPAFLLGHDPGKKVLCVSHSNDLARDFSRQFRQVVESNWYKQLFPGTRFIKTAEDVLETTAGGARRATSVEAGVTGHGGSIILIDDPVDAGAANSVAAHDRAAKFYSNVLYSRLDDKVNGQIALIQQRLHVDDLSGVLLKLPQFHHLRLSAVASEEEVFDLWNGRKHVRQPGELLDPRREPQSALDEIRATLSSADYAAQYLQDPVPDSGDILDPAWIQRYSQLPPLHEMTITLSWDTAIKGSTAADYSVCTVWGEYQSKHYLIDVYRKKVGLSKLVEEAAAIHRLHRPQMTLIEGQGSGSGLSDFLHQQYGIHSVERRPRDDKETRFSRASRAFEQQQIVFPDHAPWLADLERELFQFPGSRHDDQVDSVSQYINWWQDRGRSSFYIHGGPPPDPDRPMTLGDVWGTFQPGLLIH